MVIKLYISGISGNKEVKKKQQRVQMILDSKQIDYEAIDITEPGKEKDKEFMQQNGKVRESLGKYPLPPQIFNDEDFCGDYEDFDLANEVDELEKFLHIETSSKDSETDSKKMEAINSEVEQLVADVMEVPTTQVDEIIKGDLSKPSVNSLYNPYEYHTVKITYDDVNGLKEQIISTNDLAGENNETAEVTKSEVNGEIEAAPVLESSSENLIENIDASGEEIVPPDNEDPSVQENKTNYDKGETGNEEKADEKQEQEAEVEAPEEGEEKGDIETPKVEEVENANEETSPPLEEKVADEESEDKEIVKEKEQEDESDNESPQSEKSQED